MATIESSDAFQFTSLQLKVKRYLPCLNTPDCAPLPAQWVPSPGFDARRANLVIDEGALGYGPGTPEASRRAFRRHFIGEGGSIEQESAAAQCLLQKKAAVPTQ